MRSKKYWAILVVAVLVAILSVGLVACKKPTPPPEPKELELADYLKIVGDAFDNTYDVKFGQDFNISAALDMKYVSSSEPTQSFDKTLTLSTNVNLNDLTTAGKNLFALEYGDKGQTDPNKNFSLYADNKDIYLNLFGTKFKFTNADIFTALSGLIGTVDGTASTKITGFSDILQLVGLIAFKDCTVNEAKTTYSFGFSFKAIAEMILPLIAEQLDEQALAAIYSIVGATNEAEFLANIPAIDGKLDFHIKDAKFVGVGVSAVDFSFDRAGMTGVFDARLDVKNLSNTLDTALVAKIATVVADTTYTEAKIGAIRGAGTLQFMTGNNAFVTYDWTLEANMDIIAILTGKVLGEDNYFHFRVSHVCNDDCGAYCASKYRKGDGAIIDIGFSPKDFGTQNIYASVSLQALLGPAGVETLAPGYGKILTSAVPAYSFFTIDPTSFAYANTAFTAEATPQADAGFDIGAITGLIKPVLSVIKGINADDMSLTLDLNEILGALGQGAIMDTVNQLLSVPESPIDNIKFDIDMIRFNDTQNHDKIDVHHETVFSKGNQTPGFKSYSAMVASTDKVNTDWTPTVDDNGKAKIFVSSDLKRADLADVVLTPAEANNLINSHFVEYDTINFLTKEASAKKYRAKIVGISGIDYKLLDKPQNVTLMTAVPSDYISSIVKGALASFINMDSLLYTTVKTTITLTTELDFKPTIEELDGEFLLGEDVNSFMSYTYAKMVGGEKVAKSGRVEGWSSALVWNNEAVRAGAVGKHTITYSALGHTITKDFVVAAPATYTVEYGGQDSLQVVYDTDEKKKDNLFKYGSVTFNNADKTEHYTMYLDYGNYTMPKTAVRTSKMNIMSGSTTYGLYFNTVDAKTTMQVNLFGYETVERILDVTAQPTAYNVYFTEDSLKPLSQNKEKELVVVINNKMQGVGEGLLGVHFEYEVKIARNGGSLQPAIEGREYTLTEVAPGNFDIPNVLTGNIMKKIKFKAIYGAEYTVLAKLMGSDGKQIYSVTATLQVNTVLSSYKTVLAVDEEADTATGTYTVDVKNTPVKDVFLTVMRVEKWDTATGKYVLVPQNELIMYVNDMAWYEFKGTLDEAKPTTLNYTFKPTKEQAGQKYRISLYLHNEKGTTITGTMSSFSTALVIQFNNAA